MPEIRRFAAVLVLILSALAQGGCPQSGPAAFDLPPGPGVAGTFLVELRETGVAYFILPAIAGRGEWIDAEPAAWYVGDGFYRYAADSGWTPIYVFSSDDPDGDMQVYDPARAAE